MSWRPTAFGLAVETATIFGRITPRQKERLVQALRERGHYVAMIGDGVNDVLSLKQADLGIAMRSGSQAARGVADIVLMQDSFAVLAPAALEGQRILNGMQDILKLFLTRISTVGLVIISSLVVGVFPLELRQGSILTLLLGGHPDHYAGPLGAPRRHPARQPRAPSAALHPAARADQQCARRYPVFQRLLLALRLRREGSSAHRR